MKEKREREGEGEIRTIETIINPVKPICLTLLTESSLFLYVKPQPNDLFLGKN